MALVISLFLFTLIIPSVLLAVVVMKGLPRVKLALGERALQPTRPFGTFYAVSSLLVGLVTWGLAMGLLHTIEAFVTLPWLVAVWLAALALCVVCTLRLQSGPDRKVWVYTSAIAIIVGVMNAAMVVFFQMVMA